MTDDENDDVWDGEDDDLFGDDDESDTDEDDWFECHECGMEVHNDDAKDHEGDVLCETCYQDRIQGEK